MTVLAVCMSDPGQQVSFCTAKPTDMYTAVQSLGKDTIVCTSYLEAYILTQKSKGAVKME